MNTDVNTSRSAISWNVGGWFGTQFGCTIWILILGIALFSKDTVASWVCIAGFAVLNAWGVYLWRGRERMSAYSGLQRFLLLSSLIIAIIVFVVNSRGVSELPTPGVWVSTYVPYWIVVIAPALMLLFYLLERKAKRS